MRFLSDESLQRHVAELLADNGHNAVHVSDIGLRGILDLVSEALHRGAVITVETTRIRVRELPIKP